MTELEELKKRVAELENQINPPPRSPSTHQPYDPTANFSLPPSVVREMMKAVPDAVMWAIRDDARKPNAVTGGAPQPTNQVQRGSGWARPIPVEPPPGIELCDRMMDEQDKIDKAELALRMWKAGMLKR